MLVSIALVARVSKGHIKQSCCTRTNNSNTKGSDAKNKNEFKTPPETS